MIGHTLFASFWGNRYKKISNIFLICLSLLSITACDYINKTLYPDFKANDVKSTVDKPPFAMEGAQNISIEKVRDEPLQDIPDNNEEIITINPVEIKQAQINNNMKPIQPMGLNTEDLIVKDTSKLSIEQRVSNMEIELKRISNMMDKMSPSITKLIGIESELDSLTFQLEDLINKGKFDNMEQAEPLVLKQSSKTELASKPAPKEDATTKQAPKPKAVTTPNTGGFIEKIRLGDHPEKSRIVIETNNKLEYKIDLKGNLLNIVFSKNLVNPNIDKLKIKSALIKSVTHISQNNETIVTFELTKETQLIGTENLKPSSETPNHRIVIDLKR